MGQGINGRFGLMTHMPGHSLDVVEFETNDTSNPDGLDDPGGIVYSVARSSKNVYLVTLKDRYTRVRAWANLVEDQAQSAQVTAQVDGFAAANTITVEYRDADEQLGATESNNDTIQLWVCTGMRSGMVSA